MGLFSSFFRSKNLSSHAYEKEKHLAISGNNRDRMKLAQNPATNREILCYMAAKDNDADIRLVLAHRLTKLLPDLSTDKHSNLYKYVVDALGCLALDEVLKIRVALSSALKDFADAPPNVVRTLARDIEREVSEPILKFCAALPDEDLLEILKSHPESWAIQAIAGRPNISQPVCGGVIKTGDKIAGGILIENKNADISQDDLKAIIAMARDYPQWQKPIAMRKNLTSDLAKELVGFVDQSVRNILLERTDFPAELSEELVLIISRRVDFADKKEHGGETTKQRVLKILQQGTLNDETIGDAIAIRDDDFVMVSLSALCKTPVQTIRQIIKMKSAKSIIAICWRAGFSMRTALKIQQEMAKIPHKEIIYPRGGTDYPLTEQEMLWQLDFWEIPKE